MALDVFFKQDIRRAIRALLMIARTFTGDYQRGYIAALVAIGQVFGIDDGEGEVVQDN